MSMITNIQKQTLAYVVDILNKNNIEFQITGGLAALVYGAKRPLHDIDIQIYKKDTEKISKLFKEYITEDWNNDLEGPDDVFDLWIIKLKINTVDIDMDQIEDQRYKLITGEWVTMSDVMDYELQSFEGLEFPVQKKESLIKYKKLIGRDVDVIDLEYLSN